MNLIWLAIVFVVPFLATAVVGGQHSNGGAPLLAQKPTVSVRAMVCKPLEEHTAAACVPQLLAYATTGFLPNSTLGGKMWGFQAFEASGIPFTYQALGANPYFVVSIEKVSMTPSMAWYVTVNNNTGSGSTGGIGSVALEVNDEVDWLFHKIGAPDP